MMNDKVRSTDYLVERALGPIAEFVVWLAAAIAMIVIYPQLTFVWLFLAGISIGSFYYVHFGSKKRFLTKIEVTESAYRSFCGKHLYCTVNRNDTVYYAIFKSDEATKGEVPYIVMSNHYFVLGSSADKLMSTYDMSSMIVVQYNQTTWHLFDTQNWKCISGERLVHIFEQQAGKE